jgi:hypothetical protein
MRGLLLLIVGFLSAGLTGCLTFSSFQTADTLKAGHGSFFIGAGYQQYAYLQKSEDETTKKIQTTIEKIKVPMIEYGLRYGLSKDLDLGVRTAMFGSYLGDVKYRISQDAKTSMAFGAGISYASMGVFGRLIDLSLPFYMSYNMTPTNHLYLVPRAVFRQATYKFDYSEGNETTTTTAGGATVGIALGQDFQTFFEVSYFGGPGEVEREGILQVMLGINFGADNLDRFEHEKAEKSPAPRRSKTKGT